MNKALERAIERGGSPELDIDHGGFGPDDCDSDRGSPTIRTPRGKRATNRMREDTGLEYRSIDSEIDDLMGYGYTDGMTEAQKQALLNKLLQGHNSHSEAKRAIELARDQLDLDNKKRFSMLGYKLGIWGAATLFVLIIMLVGFLGYGIIADKSLVDGGIFSAFLNTLTEVFKTIFSVM